MESGERKARIGIDVPEAVRRELKRLALDLSTTISALGAEGYAEILKRYNRPVPPELAATGRKRRGRPPGKASNADGDRA
jgi:hypothetical protein